MNIIVILRTPIIITYNAVISPSLQTKPNVSCHLPKFTPDNHDTCQRDPTQNAQNAEEADTAVYAPVSSALVGTLWNSTQPPCTCRISTNSQLPLPSSRTVRTNVFVYLGLRASWRDRLLTQRRRAQAEAVGQRLVSPRKARRSTARWRRGWRAGTRVAIGGPVLLRSWTRNLRGICHSHISRCFAGRLRGRWAFCRPGSTHSLACASMCDIARPLRGGRASRGETPAH